MTAAVSPSSLPQSSTGRFEVSIVEARSLRRTITLSKVLGGGVRLFAHASVPAPVEIVADKHEHAEDPADAGSPVVTVNVVTGGGDGRPGPHGGGEQGDGLPRGAGGPSCSAMRCPSRGARAVRRSPARCADSPIVGNFRYRNRPIEAAQVIEDAITSLIRGQRLRPEHRPEPGRIDRNELALELPQTSI